ncbi:MAG: sigma-70 family RNA polymerase sigma factor, partial [Dehalococcoidia bacterium]
MDQLPDSVLVQQAQAGQKAAFAELYARYFDPVYDFLARMMRDSDEAADVAQDTFLKAMNAMGGLKEGARFKSWLFSIARNTALNRIESSGRTRSLTITDSEGDELTFDVVDEDRFGHPEEAAEATAAAALVWQAAAALDPKQYSLLDLHVRQGLDSAEIADVLGVTKNNGYVMVNRLKKAVEGAMTAFLLFKDGRQYCEALDTLLAEFGAAEITPDIRKAIDLHVAECPDCAERRRKLAPLAVFGGFAPVSAAPGVKGQILEGLLSNWPGPVAAAASGGSGIPPLVDGPPLHPADDGWWAGRLAKTGV